MNDNMTAAFGPQTACPDRLWCWAHEPWLAPEIEEIEAQGGEFHVPVSVQPKRARKRRMKNA